VAYAETFMRGNMEVRSLLPVTDRDLEVASDLDLVARHLRGVRGRDTVQDR